MNTNGSLWHNLFKDKGMALLLGVGAMLLLVNVLATFIDTRPGTLLFYFNMRFWSVHFSLFLWIAAIWIISESLESAEEYLSHIRMAATICITLVMAFAFQNSIIAASPSDIGHLLWQNTVVVAAVSCTVRSLFLLYDYWRDGAEYVDMEEAKWFWGLSGLLFVTLTSIWIAHIIPVPSPLSDDPTETVSLFASCVSGLQLLIQQGQGTTGVRVLGFLIITASVAFVYVAGKWTLIFLSRFRGK